MDFGLTTTAIIDRVGRLGYHVETYGSDADPRWCELVAVDARTGERFRVEADDLYEAACELARLVSIELADG